MQRLKIGKTIFAVFLVMPSKASLKIEAFFIFIRDSRWFVASISDGRKSCGPVRRLGFLRAEVGNGRHPRQ